MVWDLGFGILVFGRFPSKWVVQSPIHSGFFPFIGTLSRPKYILWSLGVKGSS